MITAIAARTSSRWLAPLILILALASAAPVLAQDPPAQDLLNAVLWMQRSVEYKAAALTAFALARLRLDQALADPNWTAAPKEQTGAYQSLPPAVILDIDETILDNSGYQAWMVLKDTTFDPKTWNAYVNTVTSLPIPGAVEFAQYADGRGVKVFYISNRTADEEPPTRKNLEKLGFPMGGAVDTMLMAASSRTGARPRGRAAPTSPRATASCSTSATTSAISSTSTGAARPSARR